MLLVLPLPTYFSPCWDRRDFLNEKSDIVLSSSTSFSDSAFSLIHYLWSCHRLPRSALASSHLKWGTPTSSKHFLLFKQCTLLYDFLYLKCLFILDPSVWWTPAEPLRPSSNVPSSVKSSLTHPGFLFACLLVVSVCFYWIINFNLKCISLYPVGTSYGSVQRPKKHWLKKDKSLFFVQVKEDQSRASKVASIYLQGSYFPCFLLCHP